MYKPKIFEEESVWGIRYKRTLYQHNVQIFNCLQTLNTLYESLKNSNNDDNIHKGEDEQIIQCKKGN